MTDQLTIRRPDDFHVHLRNGIALPRVYRYTTSVFARALLMLNLEPEPIWAPDEALNYGAEVERLAGLNDEDFTALMALVITGDTTPDIVHQAAGSKSCIPAFKLFPHGVSNLENGVSDFRSLWPVLRAMEETGMVLCVHGEMPGRSVLTAEADFIPVLMDIRGSFPDLRVVVEHVSSQAMAYVVLDLPNTAATVTVHHLVLTFDEVIGAKMHPDHFCKPVAKTEADRRALVELVTSGVSPKLFYGGDSAPHHFNLRKYNPVVWPGVFNAPVAMQMLAGVFEREDKLAKLEDFVSKFGAEFYGLPRNEGTITLRREDWTVPTDLPDPSSAFRPFWGGKDLAWRLDGQVI